MTSELATLLARIDAAAQLRDYHLEARAQLELLGALVTPLEIVDPPSYEAAGKIRCMLASLDCYTLQYATERHALVAQLAERWNRATADFNESLLITDEQARLVARYLLWTKTFTAADPRACYALARKHGLLARLPAHDGRHELVVVGLKRKVGDAVLRIDRRGAQHRCYIETLGRQAFYPLQAFPLIDTQAAQFLLSLPVLDETYHGVVIGQGKHCARPSAFTQPEIQRLYALLMGTDANALLATAPAAPATRTAPPQQLDWLAA
jgi:hypothetical protein